MAPVETDASGFGDQTLDTDATAMIVAAVSALMVGVSMLAVVIICGCCCKKDEQAPGMAGGVGGQSLYYSTDPNSTEYCAECAA